MNTRTEYVGTDTYLDVDEIGEILGRLRGQILRVECGREIYVLLERIISPSPIRPGMFRFVEPPQIPIAEIFCRDDFQRRRSVWTFGDQTWEVWLLPDNRLVRFTMPQPPPTKSLFGL